jgi:hypothetical protein
LIRLGKGITAVLLAIFLLFSASASGQAGKSVKYQLGGDLQKNNVLSGDQSIIIKYSISELNIENIVNINGAYFRVTIPGHTPSSAPGKPELPVFSRLISIPEGAEYKVKISDVTSTRIKPSSKEIEGVLIPSQESETKIIQEKKPRFSLDKTVYATRGVIPFDTVRIEPLGIVRNINLANLYVSPVSYNPHTNAIEVITSMNIEITFFYGGQIASKSLIPESQLFAGSLEKGVLNYSSNDLIPGYSEQPVKMVIITDTAFKKQIQPFIKWKTQKGFNIKVLYKGVGLAGNTYLQLKDTLTKIYKASTITDPAPEYLLIIGDTKRIPHYGSLNSSLNISDMYYGEFDGNNDYIPEMYIGRLPVADTTELKAVFSMKSFSLLIIINFIQVQ